MTSTNVVPLLTTMLQEKWYSLDPVTRSQHILSNSEIYQQVVQLESTQRAFQQLIQSQSNNSG